MNTGKNILVLSSGDTHGAYEAAYRIAKFLKEDNYDVVLAVKHKTKHDSFILQIPLSKLKKNFFRIFKKIIYKFLSVRHNNPPLTNNDYFFFDEAENKKYASAKAILSRLPFNPDLIIVGMTDGFANTTLLSELKVKTSAKIFLLTVDMFAFTGGCHYSWGCKGYENSCENCPAILNESQKDWAHKNFMVKLENIKRSNIKIMAGSGHTYDQVKSSTLFKSQKKVYNPNGLIDTQLFNPGNRQYAKHIFNIPAMAKIIFTGSWFTHDPRKGMPYFVDALNHLWNSIDENLKDNTYVLIAGEHTADNDLINKILFKKHLINYIRDYRLLSLAYQASDIFVCSSIEDSGPLMVSEALACGTPVVGFEMGAVSNMVVTGWNGYKAELKNSKELANGMFKMLNLSDEEFEMYSKNAVEQVEIYSSKDSFLKIIENIIKEDE